jgi:hypothetical protein
MVVLGGGRKGLRWMGGGGCREVEVQGMKGRLGGVRGWLGWPGGVIGCGYGYGR